jgi:hypothetical protein
LKTGLILSKWTALWNWVTLRVQKINLITFCIKNLNEEWCLYICIPSRCEVLQHADRTFYP